jgi:hypothetical protein
VQLDRKVQHQLFLVPLVQQVQLALLVHKVQLARKATQDCKVQLVHPVLLDHKVHKAQREIQDCKVCKACRDHQAQLR